MVAATENAVALTGLSVTTTGFFVSGGGDRPAGTNRCARVTSLLTVSFGSRGLHCTVR